MEIHILGICTVDMLLGQVQIIADKTDTFIIFSQKYRHYFDQGFDTVKRE